MLGRRYKAVITELVQETERTRENNEKLSSKSQRKKVVHVGDRASSTKVTQSVTRRVDAGNQVRVSMCAVHAWKHVCAARSRR